MRPLERRLKKIEKAIPKKPCPTHGKELGIYYFWDDKKGRERMEAFERELGECPYCCRSKSLFMVFIRWDEDEEDTEKTVAGEDQPFTLEIGDRAPPEMPKITFNRFDREDEH